MEKEVSRWLSHTFGYQAAADSQLSAACRGNLKGLWEFLITNHTTAERKRSIHNALSKHRREQESARRAPELKQLAQQQLQQLAEAKQKAAALERTLTSFESTTGNVVQDIVNQNSETGLIYHELRGMEMEAGLMREYMHNMQQLMPLLQDKLSQLQTVEELARSRCFNTANGGSKRLQSLMQHLRQVSNSIRSELFETLEGRKPHQSTAADLDPPLQQDHQLVMQQDSTAATAANGHHSWDLALASNGSAVEIDALWQRPERGGIVASYSPSPVVKCAAIKLLQEAPELLITCSSQLAAQASHDLTAELDAAEAALLAPIDGEAQQGVGLNRWHHQGAGEAAADGADAYSLPWTAPFSMSARAQQQQQAGYVTPEQQVKQRQEFHVQLFLRAQAARVAAEAAERELTRLLGSITLLQQPMGWEGQLAGLWLRAEGLRGEVSLLEQHKRQLERDVDAALKAEAQLQDTWQRIQATVREDLELTKLLWQVANDNLDLYVALNRHHDEVQLLLQQQLLPCGSKAVVSAQAGQDQVQREVGVLGKLPVAAIGMLKLAEPDRAIRAGMITGAKAAVGVQQCVPQGITVLHLQAAAQRLSNLGRPTTARKGCATAAGAGIGLHAGPATVSSSLEGLPSAGSKTCCIVDNATVSALDEASEVDVMAPVMCPADLLSLVNGKCEQLDQIQQQLQQLSHVFHTDVSNTKEAAAEAQLLETQVTQLRQKDLDDVLPRLNHLLESSHGAYNFARGQMRQEVVDWRDQSAQHLLRDSTYENKNCSQWFAEVQHLQSEKRRASAQRA